MKTMFLLMSNYQNAKKNSEKGNFYTTVSSRKVLTSLKTSL